MGHNGERSLRVDAEASRLQEYIYISGIQLTQGSIHLLLGTLGGNNVLLGKF